MADATKHASIHGGLGLISEMRALFSLPRTKRTVQFAYGFMLALVLFTVFFAFSPPSNSSSLPFSNLFSVSSVNSTSVFSEQSYRSHFSSIFSYFFPNSSQSLPEFSPYSSHNYSVSSQFVHNKTQNRDKEDRTGPLGPNQSTIEFPKFPISTPTLSSDPVPPKNTTQNEDSDNKIGVLKPTIGLNQTQNKGLDDQAGAPKKNQSAIAVPNFPTVSNQTSKSAPVPSLIVKNSTGTNITQKGAGVVSNLTSSLLKKQSNGSNSAKQRNEDLVNCDLFDGGWVRDDSYPLYKPGSCSLIDEQFNCFLNGRPDNGYYKLKWKPKGCSIPRLNGAHMLEMLRGKRLVFVGDSLNRNMWESLVCILRNSVKDQTKVYEASGRHHFRTEASYSFVFKDYNCTVEFFVSPFLVQEWEVADKSGSKKETLRLDLVGQSADQYKTADIIIFNTGHWWTHDKTAKGKDYYQEGSHVYSELNVVEAFRKALTTWGRWVDANINPRKSLVLFRGYSASHFSGGQWNSGGQCDHEAEPIKNTTYLSQYPPKMMVLERVLRNMRTRVSYLNVTRLTDYRKDGHPSIYRKQHLSEEERRSPLSFQDCSHWCLPGVPDTWNEILYAVLLVKQSQSKQP